MFLAFLLARGIKSIISRLHRVHGVSLASFSVLPSPQSLMFDLVCGIGQSNRLFSVYFVFLASALLHRPYHLPAITQV